MSNKIFHSWGIIPINILEVVLILRNTSLKLKTVVDNASLLNYAVSSENISERMKIKIENGFHLKQNVGIFNRRQKTPRKTVAPPTFIYQPCLKKKN